MAGGVQKLADLHILAGSSWSSGSGGLALLQGLVPPGYDRVFLHASAQ